MSRLYGERNVSAPSVGPTLNDSSFTLLNEPFGLVYAVYAALAA